MLETDAHRLWTLLARNLTEDATREDQIELKKLEYRYPQIYCCAALIIKWWYLSKIEEQTARNK